MKSHVSLATALLGAMAVLLSPSLVAQEAVTVDEEVEISRDISELDPVLIPQPGNPAINTALVFSNPTNRDGLVHCVGYNQRGNPVGRTRTRVAANGVSFILASDIPRTLPPHRFLGSVKCRTNARIVPSAYIAGPGLTKAKARRKGRQIYFPLVAVI